MKRSIDSVDVAGKAVLMRVDFNVPLDAGGRITDDRRIRSALPSIRSVIERGGRLILMSHLGRPKGNGPEPAFSLAPAADRLRALLGGAHVGFAAGSCAGTEAAAQAAALGAGEILVLENLRFEAGEKSGDETFAHRLAGLGEIYCNDAFGTAHRADASMLAVPVAMGDAPRVAGLLLRKEIAFLSDAIATAASERGGGFVAILGGAKVSDKLGAIDHLLGRVDRVLIGGAMAYTFLRASGGATGSSLVEESMIPGAQRILETASGRGTRLDLPADHVCGRGLEPGTAVEVFEGDVADGWMGLDIGPATARSYAAVIRAAKTVVWNGPMGAFETTPFDAGTRIVAEALVAATDAGAVTIVGGGDSAAAIEAFGLAERVSHVSTGGGASLRMLEGLPFSSLEVLDDE